MLDCALSNKQKRREEEAKVTFLCRAKLNRRQRNWTEIAPCRLKKNKKTLFLT